MKIKHPEWLQLRSDADTPFYGYDQDWYPTSFQRTRGCGPTTAAMLLSYVNQREQGCLPYKNDSIPDIVKILEEVWSFVTPNWLLGLNSTKKFADGVTNLVTQHGLNWTCCKLGIPIAKWLRPSAAEMAAFLEKGLSSDCPVAFLNLHRGRELTIHSWHWMLLTGLSYQTEQDRYLAVCYDNGRLLTVDVGLWLATSKLGGGFVYIRTG